MTQRLQLHAGYYSDKGRKEINQDFVGSHIPSGKTLSLKGAAFAIADGISSSSVSQAASEIAVRNFIDDYFCTSDAWTVHHAAQCVLNAINSWLCAETKRHGLHIDRNKGYVCTFSAVIFKGTIAHIVHVGDSRVYRLRDNTLEQLTNDHRLWVSDSHSYLSRALGIKEELEIDCIQATLQAGDAFVIATDGVYEFAHPKFVIQTIQSSEHDLNAAAKNIVDHAFIAGSDDNLSVQIITVDALPSGNESLLKEQIESLPFPPELTADREFDGYRILRQIHVSSRSHCYLALDLSADPASVDQNDAASEVQKKVVIKTPSLDQRDDPVYLERFLMEEWIARRVNSVHVVKAPPSVRDRHYLYTVTEYVEGQTLAQWLVDNPEPDITVVRELVGQIGRGLMAFHRMDMLHQDIKPDNIIIDKTGTAKILDFGSTRVAGINESEHGLTQPTLLGTAMYSAPEYFLGEVGSPRADIFSLGVLTYHMLSGKFPYGADVAKVRTVSAQKRLSYASVLDDDKAIPSWIDFTLKKAVHPVPLRRYEEVSEFLRDLKQPNADFISQNKAPLIERNPVMFWQTVSLILFVVVIVLVLH